MNFRKFMLAMILLVNCVFVFGQHVVRISLDKTTFQIGEVIDVKVKVRENTTGFHGAFFDLGYDGSVLDFENVIESVLVSGEANENELLYAVSEDSESSRVIVSYTLVGNDLVTTGEGRYLTLRFRVKNQGVRGKFYNFVFNSSGLIDGSGNAIAGVTWNNSANFSIDSPYSGSFITIRDPYDNQIFYEDRIPVSCLLSEGTYTVRLTNADNSAFSAKNIDVTSGFLIGETVDLVPGKNTIYARLYDNLGNLTATDTSVVFRQDTSKYLQITSPRDHQLINSDKVWVEVKSSYKGVFINGREATFKRSDYINGVYHFYEQEMWLKEGFNKITSTVTGPLGEKYTDTIEVFYQKDGSIFNIVSPLENQSFKSSENVNLFILGEIGSPFNTEADPSASIPPKNSVHVKVLYSPDSITGEETVLVDNEEAEIVSNTYDYENPTSKYVYTYTMAESLKDLQNGTLTIIAYKNKTGSSWDNKVVRTVRIDNNRLWIDLVQPNVFTSDELDTYQKIKDFNQSLDLTADSMEVSMEGGIILSASSRKIASELKDNGSGLQNVVSITQRPDGTLYALVNNPAGNAMKIYKKNYGGSAWTFVTELANYQGYSLSSIDIGILVGVSCMYSSGTSDLFLLKNGTLYPVSIKDKVLSEIKYIHYSNGSVSLYGDFYDYLYTFNTYALEEKGAEYFVNEVEQFSFSNNEYFSQFFLSSDGKTACARTDNNDILFYTKEGNSYQVKTLPLLNGSESLKGKHVVMGEYDNGDYNSYFVLKEDDTIEVVMENKTSGNLYRIDSVEAAGSDEKRIITCDLLMNDEGISLVAAGFKNNNFVFLYKKGETYFVKRGQLFFGKFYESTNTIEDYAASEIGGLNYNLVITDSSLLYGIGGSDYSLLAAYSEFKPEGTCEFNYVNDDIDRLTGFGFEIDPRWLENPGAVEFEFSALKKGKGAAGAGDEVVFKLDPVALDTLLANGVNSEVAGYTLSHNYDTGKKRDIFHFEFDRLPQNDKDGNNEYYYLNFKIKMKSVSGSASPALYGFKVYKKIYPKICKPEGDQIFLPIHGYVSDSTVTYVTIQNNQKVKVERNGAFYHDLLLHPVDDKAKVTIECTNGASKTYSLSFTVMIVESKNNIWDIQYKTAEDIDPVDAGDDPVITTNSEILELNGTFYGLAGCVLGYELYSISTSGESVLRKRGILDKIQDDAVLNQVNPGTGYEAGYFQKNNITLVPGKQRIKIFCENPGGVRSVFEFNEINYNMKREDQKIVFDLTALLSTPNNNTFPIEKELFLWTYETGDNPYSFIREYEISGEVKTLEELTELRVRSYDSRLTFENGETEINIPVETGNRFKVKFKVELGPGDYQALLDIGVFPKKSLLSHLKKGVRVVAVKSFENTNYIPDLSALHPDTWTEEQKISKKIPVRFKFNRDDVPLLTNTDGEDFAEAHLVVNYEHEISGRVIKEGEYFYLVDVETGERKYLYSHMIKRGVNRVRWQFLFNEVNGASVTKKLMSYSTSDEPGMDDYIFEYQGKAVVAPTVITFTPELNGGYYSSTDLPALTVSHDMSTTVRVFMEKEGEKKVIYENTYDSTSVTLGYTELASALREGKNTLSVSYTEEGQSEITNRYTFMFDDAAPKVKIDSYNLSADFTKLLNISAVVDEANYADGYLYYGADIVNRLPEVTIRSDNKYTLVWTNLGDLNIEPALKEVKIRVTDHAAKTGDSQAVPAYTEIERPEETDIKEIKIELPEYEGQPELVNEANYQGRNFPLHTKIAPPKFLKRVDIQESVENNGNYLIKYGKPNELGPIYWSKMESMANITEAEIGSAASVSGGGDVLGGGYAKYGNALRTRTTSGNRSLAFVIENSANLQRGAISFWSYTGGFQAHTSIIFGTTVIAAVGKGHPGSANYFMGTTFGNTTGMHHYYLIWEKDKTIQGTKSVVLYRDGVEVMSTTADFPTVFENIGFVVHTGAPVGGSDSAETSLDNIKIWDYIPMESPSWLYNDAEEDRNVPLYAHTPVYWSKCESLENVTTAPDIGEGTGIFQGAYLKIDGNGKFDNAISGNTSQNASAHFYPQGDNFSVPAKGALSFWMKQKHEFAPLIAYDLEMGGFKFRWNRTSGLRLTINGVDVAQSATGLQLQNWHHMYIVWDEEGGLDSGKTAKVYLDSQLLLETDAAITNWATYRNFFYHWIDSDDNSTWEGSCDIDIDNIKLWDKIVSEHPGWLAEVEGNEDKFGWTEKNGDGFENEGDMTPVYFTKFESMGQIETGVIGTAVHTAGVGSSGRLETVDVMGDVKWGNSLKLTSGEGAGTGEADSVITVAGVFDAGTVSTWMTMYADYPNTHGFVKIKSVDDSGISQFEVVVEKAGNNGILYLSQINILGVNQLGGHIILDQEGLGGSVFEHLYIVFDNKSSLTNGKSVRVFWKDSEVASASGAFGQGTSLVVHNNNHHYNGDGGGTAYNMMDNLKIWDNVISEDPDYVSAMEETSSLPADYGKYLVFKVAKDINTITSKDDIQDKIWFEFIGKKWDSTAGEAVIIPATEDERKIPLTSEDSYKYVEGTNYVYYMVDSGVLKGLFETKKIGYTAEGTGTFLDPSQSDVIIDPGSLRIMYAPPLTVQGPEEIYLVGKQEAETTFADCIVYDKRYESPSLIGEYTLLNQDIRYALTEGADSTTDRTVYHDASSDAVSVNFWFRIEDEALTEDIYSSKMKRLLTFGDSAAEELVYFAYNSDGEKTIVHFVDTTNAVDPVQEVGLVQTGQNDWNMITGVINKADNTLTVYLSSASGAKAKTIFTLPESVIYRLSSEDSRYFFGPAAGEEYNTGFYSVALPSYINRPLQSEEIVRLYNLKDFGIGGSEYSHTFTSAESEFTSGTLKKTGTTGHFDGKENAGYKQEQKFSGSLTAGSIHRNFLKTVESGDGSGKYFVIFDEADNSTSHNMDVVSETNGFKLIPGSGENSKGLYYFGNKTGNYGLGLDRWYSVSGQVLDMPAAGTEAYLVLRINGNEQKFQLAKGTFHFVYNNESGAVPSDVKMYIQSNGELTLGKNMVLNQGNYKIDKTMEKTAAYEAFPFDLTGTVHFFYKPFNVNKEGFVNYNTVLFDSELIKIETRLAGEDAVYWAIIKNAAGEAAIELKTNTRVSHKWQHIQLSYSCKEEKDVVYLYIDGRLAASSEGAGIPLFGSLIGSIDRDRYVHIGSNEEGTLFGEGYFDNIVISKYFLENRYQDITPVSLVYDAAAMVITQETADASTDISGALYRIEALDGLLYKGGFTYEEKSSLTELNSALVTYQPGRYRLTASMTVNGHNFDEILYFNIDNKPKFSVVNHTPIVFAPGSENLTNDIGFTLEYDTSYRFAREALMYPGAAVTIRYTNGFGDLTTDTRYLVGDYQNQNSSGWLAGTPSNSGAVTWVEVQNGNAGELSLLFENIKCTSDVEYEFTYFYFKETFTTGAVAAGVKENTENIPLAAINTKKEVYTVEEKLSDNTLVFKEYEYKLVVSVIDTTDDAVSSTTSALFENMKIAYTVKNTDLATVKTGVADLNSTGLKELYYDDILPAYQVDTDYVLDLELRYNGTVYAQMSGIGLAFKQPAAYDKGDVILAQLEIDEFSVLYLDKEEDRVSLFLRYYNNGVSSIATRMDIIQDGKILNRDTDGSEGVKGELSNLQKNGSYIYQDITVPKGASKIKITLSSDGLQSSRELDINNFVSAPELVMTNYVESEISYNDVFFSWKGYYEGVFNSNIEYTYNFDNTGWTSKNKTWRDVRFYDLEEGYHAFQVKAVYNEVESIVRGTTFFVDVNRPVFNPALIEVEKLYNADGVLYGVHITGAEGAIQDASLRGLSINGTAVPVSEDGKFSVKNLALTKDGINEFVLSAYDRVNNFREYTVEVNNPITTLLFPGAEFVRYCPMTIVGKIDTRINAPMEIYVRDPFGEDREPGDYSGWKKAKINEDRTFFIEDVFVNPGSKEKALNTTLTLVSVFEDGLTFTREIKVTAGEIIMPIELTLSTHAAEGENADTYVEIDCRANVAGISSWSIDYTGDGIYDEIDIVDNPDNTTDTNVHKWTHKYSSLGLVEPRVRVITTDGNFFSVSDSLIIHEKIKEPSHKLVIEPVSLDLVHLEDNSKRIFVLSGVEGQHTVEVYEIGRNETAISNKLYKIDLKALGLIEQLVQIRSYGKEHLFAAENRSDNTSRIYELEAGEYGNYMIVNQVELDHLINDITIDKNALFISYTNSAGLTRFDIKENRLDGASRFDFGDAVQNPLGTGAYSALSKDQMGLLTADYLNQRILRLTDAFEPVNFYGQFGTGEGEFLKPSIIKSYENRVFVYDEGRKDIQIFDHQFKTVCTLEYSLEPEYNNYFEAEFLNEVVDIEIITKEELGRVYYYALILSKSAGKLAVLRLPQWEELRARVRNNKVVFINDGELFTAKPDGSDLTKILSSDSMPRIEGELDYPALSPDGKSLVFTSRIELYNGEQPGEGETSEYAYDNVYVVDLETKELKKIELGQINGFEVERPVFNSNGDKLIFSAKPTGNRWQIYVYDLTAGGISKLFESDENARFPYYSPDDRFVVFTTDYDGDEEIEIVDTENTALRVSVTNNYARDSLPVWNRIYPYEISGNSAKKIESKIAFVSERNYHKGIHYVYVKRASDSDIRIVTVDGVEIGNDPDQAATRITNENVEGDYPCFTGDGTALLFEFFDGEKEIIKKYSFTATEEDGKLTNMELPGSAGRPAGMKNMIVNFKAQPVNGNQIELTWKRYTENDIFYIVRIKEDSPDAPITDKKVFSQTGTVLKGLEMGAKYLVKVCIVEMEEEVASSQWKSVKMDSIAARPSYRIDENNPYLVHLHGWEPHDMADGSIDNNVEDKTWEFVWIIENRELPPNYSQDFSYHFATSGQKTVALKVKSSTDDDVSESLAIDIKSDIEPVIEHVLAEDSSYIELNAGNSTGNNIDFSETVWTITGPGVAQSIVKTGSLTTVDLTGFLHKIYVNLKLKRKNIEGQQGVEIIEKNMIIDLDFKELKPVITTSVSEENDRLIKFSGEYSLGNIDWYRAEWTIFADNGVIYQKAGASTIEYQFPAVNSETVYSVSLSVPRRNDNQNATVSQIVTVEAAPIEAVIDYQILTLEEGGQVVGAKLLLDCTKSKGNGIDFSNARWNVGYGGQGSQVGPTALYDLIGADQNIVIEVSLTLMQQGGKSPVTINELINLTTGELPDSKLIVTVDREDSTVGKTFIFDARSSTGPNIDWERTEWQIDGQPYAKRGPLARVDIPASSEKQTINYTCTLYRTGGAMETVTGQEIVAGTQIYPVISTRKLSRTLNNVFELSVLNTKGANIDWERTHWYIYDGAENVHEKRGATIQHAFTIKSGAMGYPVLVELYLKGGSKPYLANTSIDVEGDELRPIITFDADPANPNVVTFNASASKGSGIDWNSAKWTFGDSTEYKIGSTVIHPYPTDSINRSYRVSLTLSRRSTNGSIETPVTVYKDITIGADKINPVITVEELKDGYMVLSAEDSEGRGLLLDRSIWLFEGAGDNTSFNTGTSAGVGVTITHVNSHSAHIENQINGPGYYFPQNSVTITNDHVNSTTAVATQNYNQSFGNSFANTNTHHGAVCRRFVGPLHHIVVTLMVYRVENNGDMKGESLTVEIDLSKARPGDTF